jgi:hypothetical protein
LERPALRRWRDAGLVISPAGLALVQGNVRGEMRWAELKDLRYKTRTSAAGIVLKFEGAEVGIINIYDRPLYLIYERIREYWR